MSLSRLCSKTQFVTYLNKAVHHSFIPRECTQSFSGRYSCFGVCSRIYGQTLGIDYRAYVTRSGISRPSCDKLYKSSVLRINGLEGSHVLHHRRGFATQAVTDQKSLKMLLYLTGLVFAMVGATYAAVPLYRTFCQATGYGGTVQRKESVEEKIARHSKDGTVTSREIVVQFNADVADGMQWKFIPTQREVRVKPGESALAFYTAENKSTKPITGVSTYNVTPMKAAVYFNKIQCFCFEEQRLLPGELIDMPVFFYIDPEFETDPKMDGINNIILSYTFFKVSEDTESSQESETTQ
ncbi:chaperone [Lithospermum erythrorhizon]|uniref:Chaperone n=1 Tax=Lithospermum erythrorhizon TaxID=34254 RepID=A0AAV3Q1M6_LITER